MTRFAWLQARTQTVTVAAAVLVIAIVAAVTGVQLSHLYNTLVAPCQSNGNCDLAFSRFLSHDSFLQNALLLLMRAAPALLGMFWGAPLVAREIESGTFRLAWTQSVTKSRWLLTRLAVVGLATLVLAGSLTLTVTWWFRAIDKVTANQYGVLDTRDLAPVGYALFAFAVGALVGALIRRTVPAMATTLAVFVFARVAVLEWVRPHLLAPRHRSLSLLDAGTFGFDSRNGGPVDMVARSVDLPNAWTLSTHIVTNSGHLTTAAERAAFLHQHCSAIAVPPQIAPGGNGKVVQAGDLQAFQACHDQAARVFHLLVTYQPASRYWTFQWLETGVFVVLALLAAAACFWWVVRRSD